MSAVSSLASIARDDLRKLSRRRVGQWDTTWHVLSTQWLAMIKPARTSSWGRSRGKLILPTIRLKKYPCTSAMGCSIITVCCAKEYSHGSWMLPCNDYTWCGGEIDGTTGSETKTGKQHQTETWQVATVEFAWHFDASIMFPTIRLKTTRGYVGQCDTTPTMFCQFNEC